MKWKTIRLELAATTAFPKGSVDRGYLIRPPLNDDGCIDEQVLREKPGREGASGLAKSVEKPFDTDVLLSGLSDGFNRLSSKAATGERKKDAQVRLEALTPREHDILEGLAQGLPNKAIAYDLGISPRTVEIHGANRMTKLGVGSLSEALRIAFAAQEQ